LNVHIAFSNPLSSLGGLFLVVAVVALIAWALQLMQAANDRQEFSLMLAGCMVCSAAVGLATVMVLTITGHGRLEARGLLPPPGVDAGISLDSLVLPWDPAQESSAVNIGAAR
jgi:hypothetical protein